MAGASLLALLDDIATILDDVAVMTKVAAKKTAGVLGDDLALNAQQVAGVRAERDARPRGCGDQAADDAAPGGGRSIHHASPEVGTPRPVRPDVGVGT